MEDKARNIPSSQFKLFSIFREESFPIRSFDKVYMYLACQTLKASMPIFQDCPPGTLAIRLVTLPKIKFLKIAKNCYIFVSYNFVWGRTFQLT
jgi:hypothetical protein